MSYPCTLGLLMGKQQIKPSVMKEFMLLVKTEGDHFASMSAETQQAHVAKVGTYIGNLMEKGQLKGAQPLELEGTMVQGTKGSFKDGPYSESKEVIVGYFHILAQDLQEAVAIAKANPLFEETEASIEVRPVKVLEGIN